MEHIPGYDSWKLATPWDGEKEITVWFECTNCFVEQEQDVIVSGRSGTVETECDDCGQANSVEFGDDYYD